MELQFSSKYFSLLISVSLMIGSYASFQSDWVVYADLDNNFSISVPGNMKKEQKSIFTEMGEMEFTTYQYTANNEDHNMIYLIHHYAYPNTVELNDSVGLIKELLEATVEESLIKLNGSLDYSEPIVFSGYPGILYRIKYNNKQAVLKSKTYIIENNFYAIQVYTSTNKSIDFKMDEYLDSFRFIVK